MPEQFCLALLAALSQSPFASTVRKAGLISQNISNARTVQSGGFRLSGRCRNLTGL
ncbi:MAG: hypothetical protein RIK87_20315 [Fuerstiella sp.]